ncbi:MAG TPA: DUF4105 domain-containing protein [Candidatus Nitrosopolaris sp.]|nr:DUF4105 domain-containing protein [Candidatus Nitrosopolaris sp.]
MPAQRVGLVRRAGRVVAVGLCALGVVGMTAWAALAIRYSDLPSARVLATLFVVATLLAFAVLPRRGRTLVGFLIAFALVVVWWRHIPASNDRDWQPEVSRLAYADIDGDHVTIHNIRNFDYRSETDFTPRWYDATFDVSQLQSVDLIASYWMGDAIAHIFVSFGFADGRHVAFSVETRKERGESYSTIAGFFKQYELYYVVADERDVIRVRTNYRQPREDVYLYRAQGPPENGRRLFLDYIRALNDLKNHPAFYNTLTTNCTTTILVHTRVNPGAHPFNWKILLSGYAPQYAYELGRLDTSLPFDELRRRSRIDDRAEAADQDPDFSQRIREGLPGMR